MSNIAWPYVKNSAICEVVATRGMINGESRMKRLRWSRWLRVCASVLILSGIALHSNLAPAATPHSLTRQCGTPILPYCPPPVPIANPWTWTGYDPYGGGPYLSEAAAGAAFVSIYNGRSDFCSATSSWAPSSWPSGPQYTDGIETAYFSADTLTVVVQGINHDCGQSFQEGWTFEVGRTISCPPGLTVTYQSSPVIGPYCGTNPPPPPAAVPANPLKEIGNCCPTVSPEVSPSSNQGGADAGSLRSVFGNPVDVSNGNKFQSETDYAGVGRNPIKFVRSYNSLIGNLLAYHPNMKIGEPFMGVSRSATYFQYLLPGTATDSSTTYNTVYAYRPDGRVLTFTEYNNVYSPDGDVADSLALTSSGGWQYQTADDTIETYNAAGQLLSIATRGQAAVTINYNTGSGVSDPPVSVSDAFGHSLQFAYLIDYSGVQRLASLTDPAGHVISYSYDNYGRLMTVTNADGTTRSYGYDTVTNGWLMVSLTDEAAVAYASWTYGNNGAQVLSSQHAGGVEAYSFSYVTTAGVITSASVTDPLGQSRTYSQDLLWGVNRTTSSSAPCPSCGEDQARVLDTNGDVSTRTDWNGNQTTYVYDLTTDLETSRTEAYGTPQARTITTAWDASWREPDLITEPNRTTAFTYDSMGNVLTKIITDTSVTPNVARRWTYTYDSYGRLLTAQGPRTDVNSTTTYAYYTCSTGSQCGQIQTITNALSQVTTFNTYDAHGQPLTVTDPNGVVTTLSYDARQRLTSRQVGTETTTYSYYPIGLLKQVTLPDASNVLYTYDAAHRLTDVTDGLGNHIHYTLDAMGNRTADNTYDPSSALRRTHTRVINALNEVYQDVNAAGTAAVTTTFGYDGNGNQTSASAPLSRNTGNQYDALNRLTQITDPASGVTQVGYDANDNLASVMDPRSLTTSYAHDGFGDVTQQVSPDAGTSTNTYDSGGNLKTATDARGAVATYAYDALNRVTQVAYTDQTINFTYDAGTNGMGRLTGATDANHALSWTYDALGRVTGKGQTVGSITKSVGYAYTNGDLASMVTPSGQTIIYGYSNHQVTSVAVNGTTIASGVSYFPFGPVSGWNWGNSTTVSRAYDTDAKITQISTAGDTINFGYDNAFRTTGITDTGIGANSWTLGYDSLDRLTSAAETAATLGWSYDANGNRLSQTGSNASTFTPSTTSNQLNSVTGALTSTYAYDGAGNATSYASNSLTFNQRGRASVATGAGGTANYVYNALGQMIEKYGTGATSLMVYDEAGHLLGEYSSTGALVQETVWMGNIPVATLQPNGSSVNIYYVHTDQLNAPRVITRPSDNAIAWRWDTDPFGTVAPNQNPASLGTFIYNLRFPGQYYQAETGLNYNYSRDYDPQTGRYVESDPIGLGGGVNTYAYTAGNPVSFIDPTGLYLTSVDAACAIDPGFCAEIMGQIIQSHGAITAAESGDQCLADEANRVANGFRAVGDIAGIAQLATAAIGVVGILEEANGAIHLTVGTSKGTVEVISDISQEGDTLILSGLHIGGPGAGSLGMAGINELKQAAADFGAARGASQVIIQGGKRTSGRRIGTVPSPIVIPTR
jgi:RHS repeat-associated protein